MLLCNAFKSFVSISLDIAKICMQWCNLHSNNKHRRNCLQSLFVASRAIMEIKTRSLHNTTFTSEIYPDIMLITFRS